MNMDLWIRSQNKELLMKSPELRYNQKENDHSILAYDTLGVYRILGTYETKERALEVLDEIQNKINLINLGHDFGSPMIDLKNQAYIYQMPKE